MAESKGSIAFFATFRPLVPLDIFALPYPPKSEKDDELHMTEHDKETYNYNGQVIKPEALRTILKRLKRLKLVSVGTYEVTNVDSGRLSGMLFVSERDSLETLYIALRLNRNPEPQVKVFSLAEVYGTSKFSGVRMEDSGCIAGDYLIYVSTREPGQRRQPWTAVYRTHLETGDTCRLTPPGQADLNPSVSPSGKKIAVASFEKKSGGWKGEIENLKTDIFVMSIEDPSDRKMAIQNGGWPTWGSDSVIFFHRKVGDNWGVYRADISHGRLTYSYVTWDSQCKFDAITPAAIDDKTVAVATIRKKSKLENDRLEVDQYRHIEIFDSTKRKGPIKITKGLRPMVDHFNPFVIDICGRKHIGYHRCKTESLQHGDDIPRKFYEIESPDKDIGLFRVSGVFPTFSRDGSKLAFVNNEFNTVFVADSEGMREVYKTKSDNIFSPVWNQNPEMDILYVCVGPSFSSEKQLTICAIPQVSKGKQQRKDLTKPSTIDGFPSNNAFPSTSPDGNKLVYRSTRDWGNKGYKNLYIMEDAHEGEYVNGRIRRLTDKPSIDTHCQWSPSGEWIVFSSTRDKPAGAPPKDNDLDPGYFAVFLVKWDNPDVIVRVVGSGDDIAGHVNHPFFSPDGRSIVVTADLAAVSADPISLPHFLHSVRPYGDIFTIDIDPDDIYKNKDVKEFKRITHSRYESATGSWTKFSTKDKNAAWNRLIDRGSTASCPYVTYRDGGNITGHLFIPKRC